MAAVNPEGGRDRKVRGRPQGSRRDGISAPTAELRSVFEWLAGSGSWGIWPTARMCSRRSLLLFFGDAWMTSKPAVAFYERLTGEPAARFQFAGLQLAGIGPFLLFGGPEEIASRFAGVAAALSVPDLDATVEDCVAAGAEVVAAAQATPNGRRAVLRHPDGGVYEYVSR